MIGDVVLVDACAEGRPRALQDIQILQEKRHAGEGTIRKSLFDLPLRIVVMLYDHCVDLRIDFAGTGDRLVQQFLGTDMLVADELGKAHPVIAAIFLEGHFDTRCDDARMPAKSSANAQEHSAEHVLIDDVLTDRFAIERAQNIARGLLAHSVHRFPRYACDVRGHDDVGQVEQRMA